VDAGLATLSCHAGVQSSVAARVSFSQRRCMAAASGAPATVKEPSKLQQLNSFCVLVWCGSQNILVFCSQAIVPTAATSARDQQRGLGRPAQSGTCDRTCSGAWNNFAFSSCT
jgi:hypothetical protein